jgi:hypothetical protein
MVQGQLRQIVCETPVPKLTKQKWTGDGAQAVVCLLFMHEALSSNPKPIFLVESNQKDYDIIC